MEMDERNLRQEQKWFYENLCNQVVDSLNRNNIYAEFAPDREQALDKVKRAIPDEATIGIGDSVTLYEIGLFSWLKSLSNRIIFNPFAKTDDGYNLYRPEERLELMRKALISDLFLCSSNAVTRDGKLVNIDARGNRVAAIVWGPRKVILVIGANKIVKNVEEGLNRIRNTCVPLNTKRHILKHHYDFFEKIPCAAGGGCIECNSPMKVCRKIVIIDGQLRIPGVPGLDASKESGIHVVMVGESLGI